MSPTLPRTKVSDHTESEQHKKNVSGFDARAVGLILSFGRWLGHYQGGRRL
jgi:hypothetical protein